MYDHVSLTKDDKSLSDLERGVETGSMGSRA